ncbi:hypothetical protein [Caryophanon latum]|uniref:Lipoprotein n=1 Tax=Caryophanon latum TaxID=33977 RepID=A0A1C0YPC5_9BACL|nr:hypothetical protein [Caryophanon latum]OCS89025.1 hypothetical protein A6K76_13210 [Caryophanon latum]
MKKWMIGLSAALLLTGCGSDAKVQENINKGLEEIAEDNFAKAEALFELALEESSKDESAKAYLQQVTYIQEASEASATEAIATLDMAINVEHGSSVISAKAEEQKEALQLVVEQQKSVNETVKVATALAKQGRYDESNEKMASLSADTLAAFPTIQQEVTALKEANTTALQQQAEQLAKEEAAKAEAAKQEAARQQAAKEAAEKAAAQQADPYAWAPGVKKRFEQRILDEGFIDSIDTIRYEQGSVYNNEGYLQVYAEFGGTEYRIVSVNVKTGDFSGL